MPSVAVAVVVVVVVAEAAVAAAVGKTQSFKTGTTEWKLQFRKYFLVRGLYGLSGWTSCCIWQYLQSTGFRTPLSSELILPLMIMDPPCFPKILDSVYVERA